MLGNEAGERRFSQVTVSVSSVAAIAPSSLASDAGAGGLEKKPLADRILLALLERKLTKADFAPHGSRIAFAREYHEKHVPDLELDSVSKALRSVIADLPEK